MSEIKLTKGQRDAVFLEDKNIIVSAQAGAGKTQVLVSRIINLIETKNVDIDEMLIVTFTNKAASEMKSRIKKELNKKIQNSELDAKKFYHKQYIKTTNAQISTMHSFCITILRSFFYKLGLNPGFKLLKNSSLDLVKWKSINDVFDKYYKEENKEFFNLIETYSRRYSDEDIKSMILNIYNFIQSQIKPFEWLDNNIYKYGDKNDFNDENRVNKLKNEIYQFYKDIFLEIYSKAIEIRENIYDINSNDLYIENIEDDFNIIDNIYNSKNFDEFFTSIKNASFSRKSRITAKQLKDKNIDIEIKENISDLLDEYRNDFKKFFSDTDIDLAYEINSEIEMKRLLLIIKDILQEFDEEFKKNKLKQNALDFNDLEHLTIELLDDMEIVNEIKEKYKYIFFDEYQDSNQIQDYIINKIKSETNLFFVGDIKQSIYKFRLADPIIFKNRYESYSKDKDSVAIDLVHNFRTEKKVLDFNNYIFNVIMTEEVGDVNYNTEGHRFNAGKSSDSYTDNYKIETNYIYIDEKEYRNLEISKEDLLINPEIILAGEKIKELIEFGSNYKDIVILSRTTGIIREMQDYLNRLELPNYSDSSIYSYEDIEIKVFIQMLKAIDNDLDDIVLLSALTSTIGGLNDEDLANIRGEEAKSSFNERFRNIENRQSLSKKLQEKIKKYEVKMMKYRSELNFMSISDFVWNVLVDSGHMSYVLSKNNGDKILENIKLFIDEIKELENTGFQTYSSFINYIDRMIDKNLSERESGADLSEEDDVIRLMTIHKSKGLEFKNVILLNMNKGFNKMDLNSKITLNDDYGIALSIYDEEDNKHKKTFNQNRINSFKEKELLSEEMRILYVALSRAESNLILISSDKKKDIEIKSSQIKSMNSYHEWIYSVLTNNDIDNSINYSHHSYLGSDLLSRLVIESDKNIHNFSDHECKDEINRIINFSNEITTDIPFKKTVSEISSKNNNRYSEDKDYEKIVNEDMKTTTKVKMPNFKDKIDEKSFDSLQIGTLYHYIFEKLPYNISETKELYEFLVKLEKENFITNNERNTLNTDIIMQYINSPLYNRISNSNNIEKERAFTMVYQESKSNILVDGQIDLYFEEDGELVIVDFKTNKRIDDKLYEKQLSLYQEGLEKATGKKVKEKILYWIMHAKSTSI